ncbi:MAG TPA: nitrous oxide reductase family maturation protein NosD [Acidimicrobiales bacterium]|nr:nitrous oxide reductase family maturation protein NosD [Acidimicrobiales bacterium]
MKNLRKLTLVLTFVFFGLVMGTESSEATLQPGDLQLLIDKAEPGDVIVLEPGVWEGGVLINKPLSLIGGGEAIIDGGGEGSVITVKSSAVTLNGLIIRNSGTRLDQENSGISSEFTPDIRIENNKFESVLFGVFLRHADRALISGNEIGGMDLFIARRGDGIRIWQSEDAVVENNYMHNGRDAVFWFTDRVTVRSNHVTDSRYGLHFMYSDEALVEGNLLENNSVGAFLMYSTDLTVLNNIFRNNKGPSGYGLGIKDVDGLLVQGNRFTENRSGFYADNSPSRVGVTHLIDGNVFAFNDIGVLLGSTVARNTFTGNAFLDNAKQAASDGTGGLGDNSWADDGVGNYWSDFAGFDANEDGVGDIAYQIDNLFFNLVERHPSLSFFNGTPAALFIDMASQAFPHLRADPILIDESPLIELPEFNPTPFPAPSSSRFALILFSTLFLILAALIMTNDRFKSKPLKTSQVI